MECLARLPNIEHNLLYGQNLQNSLNYINENIEIVAMHIDVQIVRALYEKYGKTAESNEKTDEFCQKLRNLKNIMEQHHKTAKNGLNEIEYVLQGENRSVKVEIGSLLKMLLAKIHFIRSEYLTAMKYFDPKSPEEINHSFYYNHMHIRLIDVYLRCPGYLTDEARQYIKDLVKKEKSVGIELEKENINLLRSSESVKKINVRSSSSSPDEILKKDSETSLNKQSKELLDLLYDETFNFTYDTLKLLKRSMRLQEFHNLVLDRNLVTFIEPYIDALIYTTPLTNETERPEKESRKAKEKDYLFNLTYNEVEGSSTDFDNYNLIVGKKLSEYLQTLAVSEQFRGCHFIAENHPKIVPFVKNEVAKVVLDGSFTRMVYKTFFLHEDNFNEVNNEGEHTTPNANNSPGLGFTSMPHKDSVDSRVSIFSSSSSNTGQKALVNQHATAFTTLSKNNIASAAFSGLVKSIKKNLKAVSLPLIFSNTFMNLCTGNDMFYRKNESFFRNLRGWNKYISVQCFGLIHGLAEEDFLSQGHNSTDAVKYEDLKGSMNSVSNKTTVNTPSVKFIDIIQDLLPHSLRSNGPVTDNVNSAESAALHALGLVNQEADFLFNFIESENFFGAVMGIANTFWGTSNKLLTDKFLEHLKNEELHYESFAFAIGKINAGSFNFSLIEKLISIVKMTEHTRIAHACAHAISMIYMNDRKKPLVNYKNTDKAWKIKKINSQQYDEFIREAQEMVQHEYPIYAESFAQNVTERKGEDFKHEESSQAVKIVAFLLHMAQSQCSWLRVAAARSLGTFFTKTGNVRVVDRLVSLAKDTDQDVRRAAILGIGLVVRERNILKVLSFFAMSHCPFTRGAVCLVLGMFYSATSHSDTVDLLETLLYDNDPLVVQQACIGLGLLLQHTNSTTSNFKRIVNRIDLLVLKQTDNAIKHGALLFRGLVACANSKAHVTYKTPHHYTDFRKITNLLLFYEYNYFYMLMIYLGQCIQPSVYLSFKIIPDSDKISKSKDSNLSDKLTSLGFIKYQNVWFKHSKKAVTIDTTKKIGLVEAVPLPKRKMKKFKRRNETAAPITPHVSMKLEKRGYFIKSGERMTYRELLRSNKMDYSIIFEEVNPEEL